MLVMYTIIHRPIDLPGVEYAVRVSYVGATIRQGELMGTAATLDSARMLVPPAVDGRVPRMPGDTPGIVEVWM